ncbi:MAG: hypothetical protein KJO17_00225 [Acidimicrobiia bacterium]|nr:hypothetical protein [Acidimicrobiia bacterium]
MTAVRSADGSRGIMADREPEVFFSRVLETFERAADRAGTEHAELTIAGRRVTLQFAGPTLLPLVLPALHQQAPGPESLDGLTVKLFDSSSTQVVPPAPPWGPHAYGPQGAIEGFNSRRYRTAYRVDAACLSLVDLERKVAVFWIRDADRYPTWMRAAPLRTILGWWAATERLQMVHGAAVGIGGAGVLITAPGGSGKSTTALRCLIDGFRYAGDDYVLVDADRRVAHPVYATAKADDRAIDAFFPQLKQESSGVIEGDTRKHVFLLDRVFADRLHHVRLSAIAVPSLTDGPSTFTPAGSVEALKALAPSTLFQQAGSGREDFDRMAELVRSVPIYLLSVSRNGEIERTIAQLLATVAGNTP